MEIKRTFNDTYFLEKSRFLGNCYVVYEKSQVFHYEFILDKNEATIISDTDLYLLEVIEFFRNDNAYVTIFKTKDGSFYKAFDPIFTFKLPLSILQVSTLFLNKKKIKELGTYMNLEDVVIPVKIIQDEYVVLDGHHRLYLAYAEEMKMVSVYIEEKKSFTDDILYLAKEQNIKQIGDVKLLSNEEYEAMWTPFKESFYTY